ncbi:nucleoside-triphosphatase [Anaerosalibacter massiliensis]|uniref:Nucleoside-triphosphatase n=1 Tax=Anaerosalibacter massiliensis TaxID=1347392 RepID=A0A9X2MIF4_9FIRM|nr:nucleoside-triphosphatase [Anaerosalibacter massiliensis]MCR2043675.1 nucleoside-triphosphatase [Anaerosalibacter massiliensis]
MNNLFLTGEIKVGKSTVLKKVLKKINIPVGGYMTEKTICNDITTHTVKSLYDNIEKYIIAKINNKNFSRKIFMESFSTGIPSILDKSLENRDIIVLDELGFMENDINIFTSKIYRLLDSDKIVLGVLKKYDCEFLNNIKARDDVIIIEITEENRDLILNKILNIIKSFNIPLK